MTRPDPVQLPMGAALALIEGFLKVTKPLGASLTWSVVLHLAAQLMLGVDHFANAHEEVGVIHHTAVRIPAQDHIMIMAR